MVQFAKRCHTCHTHIISIIEAFKTHSSKFRTSCYVHYLLACCCLVIVIIILRTDIFWFIVQPFDAQGVHLQCASISGGSNAVVSI